MPSSSRVEEVCPSGPKKGSMMTLVISFLSPVESCGRDQGISCREEEVCPSSPKKGRSMTMVFSLPSAVESCGGGHGIARSAIHVL